MTQDAREKDKDFAKFLQSLPEEQRVPGNEVDRRVAEKEYQSFHVPDFDLIATDCKGLSCPIQVKTIKGGAW